MNRKQSFNIELVDIDKLTKEEALTIIRMHNENKAEFDPLTKTLYLSKEAEDTGLALLKKGRAKEFAESKFPKRWVKSSDSKEEGVYTKDNEKYIRLTADNLATATDIVEKVDTTITKKFLEAMTLTPLKDWIRARGLDKQVDLRMKKADIIIKLCELLNIGEENEQEGKK